MAVSLLISKRGQHCVEILSGYNALGDLVFALFPTVTVWRLQIYLPLKVGLCLLMGLGVFTSVCAAMKTYELYNATETEDVTCEFWPTRQLAIVV